jgi:hypothetical protein
VRPHLLYAGLAAAAAVAIAAWWADHGGDGRPASPVRVTDQRTELDAERGGAEDSEPVDESHVERAMRELRHADATYLAQIAELRALASQERDLWSSEQATAFDKRIAEFDRVTLEHRKRLAHDESGHPGTRDRLFALYQAEIAFLVDAALGEL